MLRGSRRSASGISHEKRRTRTTAWRKMEMNRKRFIAKKLEDWNDGIME
jgi:hypothetical protein